jgi:hypothetical protein
MSGEAYTPRDFEGRQSGEDYSRNGPYESQLSMKLSKVFKLPYDRRLELVFQGWNILNRKNVTEVDPQTGLPYEPGEGTMIRNNTQFYRIQYSNPAYFGVPRNFRVAVSYEW